MAPGGISPFDAVMVPSYVAGMVSPLLETKQDTAVGDDPMSYDMGHFPLEVVKWWLLFAVMEDKTGNIPSLEVLLDIYDCAELLMASTEWIEGEISHQLRGETLEEFMNFVEHRMLHRTGMLDRLRTPVVEEISRLIREKPLWTKQYFNHSNTAIREVFMDAILVTINENCQEGDDGDDMMFRYFANQQKLKTVVDCTRDY